MKTFVILSDSHGHVKNIEKLRPLFAENDYIVHLGDGRSDMFGIIREFPDKVYALKGNCDFSYGVEEDIIEVEGISILLCHGHRYGVKSGLTRLALHAKERGCSVALYGHTHTADIREVEGVLCVNPGSLASYTTPSYCYLVVHNKKATATIVNL